VQAGSLCYIKNHIMRLIPILFFCLPITVIAQQRYPVKIDGKWGLIDDKGTVIVQPVYDVVGDYDEDYAVVQKAGKTGLIDKTGKVIIPAEYVDVSILDSTLFVVFDGEKRQVLNREGRTILETTYELIEVREGEYLAYIQHQKWGMVHISGRQICPPNYHEIELYENRYVLTKDTLGTGLTDVMGKVILPPHFQEIKIHDDDLFFYKKNNLWGANDRDKNMLLNCEWDTIAKLSNNFVVVENSIGKSLYSHPARRLISENEFGAFRAFFDDHVYCIKNGKKGLMDAEGNIVLPPDYDEIITYNQSGTFRVLKGGNWGVVAANPQGESSMIRTLIPINYDYVAPPNGNITIVRKNNLSGIVNAKGEEVIAPKYERIKVVDGTVRAFSDGKLDLLTFNDEGRLEEESKFKKYGTIKIGGRRDRELSSRAGGFRNDWEENIVEKFEWYQDFIKEQWKWGLRDRATGKIVIPPTFDDIDIHRDLGFTVVMRRTNSDHVLDRTRFNHYVVYGIINNDVGKPTTQMNLIDIKLNDIKITGLPVARCVFVGGKHGLMTRKGKIIEDNARWIGQFWEGRAYISWKGTIKLREKNGDFDLGKLNTYMGNVGSPHSMEGMTKYDLKLLRDGVIDCEGCEWGYIDTLGNTIISPQYEKAQSYKNGIALIKSGGKWGMIDRQGGTLLDPEFSNIKFIENTDNQLLRIFADKEQYGVIDSLGRVVADIVYQDVMPCTQERIGAKRGGKWGFVDTQGRLVTPFKYEKVQPFSEGLAAVRHGRKWGYINLNGDLVIEHNFRKVGNFNGSLAPARKEGSKLGYINKKGEMVIPHTFHECSDFEDAMARVRVSGEWGLIDPQGNYILKPKYRKIAPFSEEGVAVAQLASKDAGYALINRQGGRLTKQKYSQIEPLREGIAVVRSGGKYGYINAEGEEIVLPKYSNAEGFSEDRARVMYKNRWGYIDSTGSEVITTQYSKCQDFTQGKAVVYMGYRNSGLIDSSGQYFIEPEVSSLQAFTEGRGLVRTRQHQYYFVDESGALYKGYFQKAKPYQYGVAPVKTSGKWGLINRNGITLIAPKFSDVDDFDEGYARVRVNRFAGIADLEGNIILEPEYELTRYIGNQLLRIEQGNKIGYMDVEGNWVWALRE